MAGRRHRRRGLSAPTWRDLRVLAERRLRDAGAASPDVEARWLIERASGYDGVELVMADDEPASTLGAQHLDDMLHRRAHGEPLQYVLGSWPFLGHDLFVDPRVLVPRPETEVVAQVAVDEMVRLGARRGRSEPWANLVTTYIVADLGTGSGALALALASELPDAEVWATDVSDDALAVARANFAGAGSVAARLRAGGARGSRPFPVISKDAYASSSRTLPISLPTRSTRCRLRSSTGSRAGHSSAGRPASRRSSRSSMKLPTWLDPRGSVLVCELAPHQARAMTAHALAQGFVDVSVRPDLAGRDRVLVARFVG